ncbi:MAG: nucleoside recognition domain-containing protein [Bacteroidota bacterium]
MLLIKDIFKEVLAEALQLSLMLFKIMIPVSVFVKIIQATGLIYYIGLGLAPLMHLTGLPGEMGIVWATGMLSNLYGGIIAMLSIPQTATLTVAQITTLTTMMLVAHTFLIELVIARKSGIKLVVMFLLRFGFGFILGLILHLIYSSFHLLQDTTLSFASKFVVPPNETLMEWAVGQLKNYFFVFVMILSLVTLIKILKSIGLVDLMTKLLSKPLRLLGIGEHAITITIIGLTLGISYGGAMIIKESKKSEITKREIFHAMLLMGLCHSVFEDTILVMSLGGHWSGVLLIRVIFAFLVTWGFAYFTAKMSDAKFNRYLMVRDK